MGAHLNSRICCEYGGSLLLAMTSDISSVDSKEPRTVEGAPLSYGKEDLLFRNQSSLELANLYYEKCDFKNATNYLEKAKKESLEFKLYNNYFQAIALLMRVHAEKLEQEKVKQLAEEVSKVGASISNYAKYAASIKYNQAVGNIYENKAKEAEEAFEESLQMAKKYLQSAKLSKKELFEAQKDILKARFGLAASKFSSNDNTKAEKLFKILSADLTKLSYESTDEHASQLEHLEAAILIAIGNVHREKKEYQKALDQFWKAHSQIKTHKAWCYYYYVLLGMGRVYLAMGDVSKAKTFFDLVEDATENLGLLALKKILHRESFQAKKAMASIVFDCNKKLIIEKEKGEISFDRRFILLEILCLLASAPGQVFSKQEIVETIWKMEYNPLLHDNKVYTSINRVRKLIEVDFKKHRYILNERNGYSFNRDVNVEWIGKKHYF